MDVRTLQRELDDMGLITDKLQEWALTRPEKNFLYYGDEDASYTYRDFNRLVNCLANNITTLGVFKGDRVCLFLKNPLVITLSMFALWKIGAVFCPINFLYKDRQLSYQLKDSQPKLLITEIGQEPVLNRIRNEISGLSMLVHRPRAYEHDFTPENNRLRLEADFNATLFDELLSGNDANPNVPINYWDIANIIYTSGTTGKPKGVVQSFRWMQNYCYYGVKLLHPEDVVYCDLPLHHIGGAFSLIGRAAWKGCSTAVWDRFSVNDFWQRIHRSRASYTLLLDVMIPRLLQDEPKSSDRYNTLRRVHLQPLPEYHNQFARRFGIDFVNVGYGATEIGYACAAMIDESAGGGGTPAELVKGYTKEEIYGIARTLEMPVIPFRQTLKKGFMGKTCLLHQLAILDEHDREVAPGKYGQIGLRSNLSHVLLNEYFNNPEATLEACRNLWFHTGDGAYQDSDGMLYFVDRMGGFIRVKGENISSFQVEDVINLHPKVIVSAAFPIAAKEGLEDDIVIFVVPLKGQELTEHEIRSWAEKKLPRYMRPTHIRIVESLPETPTHKVEKYKLKETFLEEAGKNG